MHVSIKVVRGLDIYLKQYGPRREIEVLYRLL
jgi:hypothetical protein